MKSSLIVYIRSNHPRFQLFLVEIREQNLART